MEGAHELISIDPDNVVVELDTKARAAPLAPLRQASPLPAPSPADSPVPTSFSLRSTARTMLA